MRPLARNTLFVVFLVGLLSLVSSSPLLATAKAASQAQPLVEQAAWNAAATRQRAMDFRGALAILDPAVETARAQDDAYWQGRLLTLKATVLANSGSIQRARTTILEAIRSYGESGEARLQAEVLVATGAMHLLSGQRALCLEVWQQAIRQLRAAGAHRRATMVETDLANASANLDPPGTIHRVARILAELDPSTDPHTPRAMGARAYALQASEQFDEALAAYDQVIPLAWQYNDQQTLRFAYCNRAELHRLAGRTQEAEADLRLAVAGFETQRDANQLTGEERTSFLERQVNAYDRWIMLLTDTYRGDQAFDIAERFHARTFLDMLRERDLDQAARSIPELRARERELYRGIARLRNAGNKIASNTPVADTRSRKNQLQGLLADLAEHRTTLRAADQRYADLVRPSPPSQEDLRSTLTPNEVLIAYWRTKHRLIVWTLSRENITTTQIPLAKGDLETTLAAYLTPLRSSVAAQDLALRGGASAHLDQGRRLHGWLIEPLPAEVHQATRWIIVRHGDLNRLPFEALVEACPEDVRTHASTVHSAYLACRFVGLEKEIVYVPSAAALLHLRNRESLQNQRSMPFAASRVLALAPHTLLTEEQAEQPTATSNQSPESGTHAVPHLQLAALSHSDDEVMSIGASFPNADIYLGRDATEALLKKQAGNYAIIHLATHGLVDDEEPMVSALVLSPTSEEDGVLLAGEILSLNLRAQLVTLSACRTARGKLRRGEGFVGLQQAFLYAGAHAVLASLWDVDDQATWYFMRSLYEGLAAGLSRSAALLGARQTLFGMEVKRRVVLRERRVSLAHPRFWAGFALTGAN